MADPGPELPPRTRWALEAGVKINFVATLWASEDTICISMRRVSGPDPASAFTDGSDWSDGVGWADWPPPDKPEA